MNHRQEAGNILDPARNNRREKRPIPPGLAPDDPGFAGTSQRSHLFIPAEGDPVLLVKKNYERARMESTLPEVISLGNVKGLLHQLEAINGHKPGRLGFELDVLPTNLYYYYKKLMSLIQIVDISAEIRHVKPGVPCANLYNMALALV